MPMSDSRPFSRFDHHRRLGDAGRVQLRTEGTGAAAARYAAAAAAGKPVGAGAAAHRAGRRLLRACANGRRDRGAQSRGADRPRVRARVQRLRSGVRGARRRPQSGAELRARARASRPTIPTIHHNWGWYLCEHKREREALEQFEIAVRNSLYRTPEIALVNAGRCAQTIGEIRVAESYFRRALGAQPGNALASYGVALIAYKEARYEEARRWMRAVMQTTHAATRGDLSRGLYRAQAGRQAGGAIVHIAAAQSLSGFRRNQSPYHRGLRVTATQEQMPNDVDGLAPVAASAGPGARLRAAREAAGLSLDQVAQQLKLAPRQVKALEEESFGELPGRTFSRGFVRNYARLLHLDAQDLLAHLPDVAQAPALESPTLHSTGFDDRRAAQRKRIPARARPLADPADSDRLHRCRGGVRVVSRRTDEHRRARASGLRRDRPSRAGGARRRSRSQSAGQFSANRGPAGNCAPGNGSASRAACRVDARFGRHFRQRRRGPGECGAWRRDAVAYVSGVRRGPRSAIAAGRSSSRGW